MPPEQPPQTRPNPEQRRELGKKEIMKGAEILLGKGGLSLAVSEMGEKDKKRTARYFDHEDPKKIEETKEKAITEKVKSRFSDAAILKAAELSELRERFIQTTIEIKEEEKSGLSRKIDGARDMTISESERGYERKKVENAYKEKLNQLANLLMKDEEGRLRNEYQGETPERLNEILQEKLFGEAFPREWVSRQREYRGGNYATGDIGHAWTEDEIQNHAPKNEPFDPYALHVTKIIEAEIERHQENLEMSLDRENSKHSLIKKTLSYWSRLPRSARIALSGVTGFVATGGLALPLVAGAGYLGIRVARSAIGTGAAMVAQKYITENIIKYGINPLENFFLKRQRDEILSVENAGEIMQDGERQAEAIHSQNYEAFTRHLVDESFRLEEEVRGRSQLTKRIFKGIRGGTAVLTGIAAGVGAASAFDYAVGAMSVPAVEAAKPNTPPPTPEETPAPVPIEDLASAKKGDSVWTLIEENAEKNVKGFNDLNTAQKTYFIDHLKDQVDADPTKFGLSDADKIQIGYGKQLGSLFENTKDVESTLETAKNLSRGQMDSILKSNAAQRAAFLDSIKPKIAPEITSDSGSEIVHDDGGIEDGTLVKEITATDPYGEVKTAEIPAEILENKELAQAYLNLKGNPNFAEGSQAQDWARIDGAEHLQRLVSDHPEYLQMKSVRDALREIHTNNIVNELGEGGAFKFLNSADHADLMRETIGLSKTYGLDAYGSHSFSEYIAQGNEMNEGTFTPFINPDDGTFVSDAFSESIKEFNAIASLHTLPEIPSGSVSSMWEPRLLSVKDLLSPNETTANGLDNAIGLVRQSSPGVFEYKILGAEGYHPDILKQGLTTEEMQKVIALPPSKQ